MGGEARPGEGRAQYEYGGQEDSDGWVGVRDGEEKRMDGEGRWEGQETYWIENAETQ
jgi:hypothetical protein